MLVWYLQTRRFSVLCDSKLLQPSASGVSPKPQGYFRLWRNRVCRLTTHRVCMNKQPTPTLSVFRRIFVYNNMTGQTDVIGWNRVRACDSTDRWRKTNISLCVCVDVQLAQRLAWFGSIIFVPNGWELILGLKNTADSLILLMLLSSDWGNLQPGFTHVCPNPATWITQSFLPTLFLHLCLL